MGRAERRKAEKVKAKDARKMYDVVKAHELAVANRTKLTNNAINEIQDSLTNFNLTAVFNAFAYILADKYNMSDIEIGEILTATDDLVGKVGSEEFPTISEFKVFCTKKHGVNIGLTDEEIKIVEGE